MDSFRKELLARRLAAENRSEKEKAIARRLLPFLEGKTNIGIYHPVRGEVDILSYLPRHLQLYSPAVISHEELEFRRDKDMKPGVFGILEPEHSAPIDPEGLEVILVPLLGFCRTWRIGYGAGYYDRYLPKTNALTIGLAFDEQEIQFQPDPWDYPLDYILTPQRLLKRKEQ